MLLHSSPFIPEAGRRAGFEVIGDLALPLIRYNTQASGLYAVLGQHSKVDPEHSGVEDPTLRT